jgi:hypothetical protein
MEEIVLAQSPRSVRLAVEGTTGIVFVTAAAILPFRLTANRCQTNPPGDTSSEWSFSSYCTALHAVHVFDYPDAVSGGGILEGVFALPIVISLAGLIVGLRIGSVARVRKALLLSCGLVALMILLALTLASATFHPCC